MTTFDELFAEHNLTPNERKALVMHLATLRAQKTVEALQDCPLASAPSTPPPAVEAVPLDEHVHAVVRSVQPYLDVRCRAWQELTEQCRYWLKAERAHGIAPKAAQEKT